jgi:hypothetical protein
MLTVCPIFRDLCKYVSGGGEMIEFLMILIVAIGGLAIMLGWFIGVPLAAFYLIDGHSVYFFFTIWFGILLISNISRRIKAQNKVDQYEKLLGVKK